jgi:hypothetical protein
VLVGRAAELDLFRALLRDLVAGRGRSVLVEGEPGIGKSALVTAGLGLAATLGCRVLPAAADIWFAMGQWDDALAASDVAAEHLPAADAWPELWERVYGMKALICGHRDDIASVQADLNRPKIRGSDSILLVRARALAEERAGRPEGALAVLRETLDPNRTEKY